MAQSQGPVSPICSSSCSILIKFCTKVQTNQLDLKINERQEYTTQVLIASNSSPVFISQQKPFLTFFKKINDLYCCNLSRLNIFQIMHPSFTSATVLGGKVDVEKAWMLCDLLWSKLPLKMNSCSAISFISTQKEKEN